MHGELTIGRDPGCVLRLDDPKVSRRHATLAPVPGGLRIRDEGSLNGTWVNDGRIAGTRGLLPGDRVRIGGSEFLVDDGDGDAPLSGATTAPATAGSTPTILVGSGEPS